MRSSVRIYYIVAQSIPDQSFIHSFHTSIHPSIHPHHHPPLRPSDYSTSPSNWTQLDIKILRNSPYCNSHSNGSVRTSTPNINHIDHFDIIKSPLENHAQSKAKCDNCSCCQDHSLYYPPLPSTALHRPPLPSTALHCLHHCLSSLSRISHHVIESAPLCALTGLVDAFHGPDWVRTSPCPC